MTGASGIEAAKPRNRVQENERQLLIFAFTWRTATSDYSQWQLRAQSRSSLRWQAVVRIEFIAYDLRIAAVGGVAPQ